MQTALVDKIYTVACIVENISEFYDLMPIPPPLTNSTAYCLLKDAINLPLNSDSLTNLLLQAKLFSQRSEF